MLYENEMVKFKWKKQWTTTKVLKHQYLFIHVKYHIVNVIKKYQYNECTFALMKNQDMMKAMLNYII